MPGAYSQAVFHLIKAIALFGVGLGILLAVLASVVQFETMDLDPETIRALGVLFDIVGYSIIALFVWSSIEFAASVWSIPHVRQGADWVKERVGGVA